MSIHKSLAARGKLVRARSVLTRYERILQLRRGGHWGDDSSPFGLPKVRVQKPVEPLFPYPGMPETVLLSRDAYVRAQ